MGFAKTQVRRPICRYPKKDDQQTSQVYCECQLALPYRPARLGESCAMGPVDLLTWAPSIRLVDAVSTPCSSVNAGLVGVEVVIVAASPP